jgi:hypothetical protein
MDMNPVTFYGVPGGFRTLFKRAREIDKDRDKEENIPLGK